MEAEFELHRGPVDELQAGWEALFAADPQVTPYASWGWSRAWWRHFAEDAQPWVLTAHSDGELVGLVPLVIHRRGPFRIVRALGRDPGDYWDMLALPGAHAAVATAAARELVRRRRQWDLVDVGRIPPESPLTDALTGPGLTSQRLVRTPCPTIDLAPSFDEYLAGLPTARRTNFRRRLRHLDEGELELTEVDAVEEIPAAVDRWQAMRVRQWREMGKQLAPMHASRRMRDFMVDLLEWLVPAGLALIWEFHREGELVGSFVNFVDEGAFYQYLGGFEPRLARLGIGKIATCHGIRTSIEAGRRRYDFMVGEEEYKYQYGAVARYATSVIVSGAGPRSRAAVGLQRLKRSL